MADSREFIAGFTRSAWKSLAVKSQRIGWPAGLERAVAALGKSAIRPTLISNLFEDTFPAVDELQAAVAEIVRLDFTALCSRETHHRRGLTQAFYDLREPACHAADHDPAEQQRLYQDARRLGIWLPRRALNCFWTWQAMAPTDSGIRRTPDLTPWRGMPPAVLDSHCYEGKVAGTGATILSGHYDRHLELSRLVATHGWEYVRQIVHSQPTVKGRRDLQGDLFQP